MNLENLSSVQIKTSIGVVTITSSQFNTLISELYGYLQSLNQQLWSLEEQLNNSTSMTQVKSINWIIPMNNTTTNNSTSI